MQQPMKGNMQRQGNKRPVDEDWDAGPAKKVSCAVPFPCMHIPVMTCLSRGTLAPTSACRRLPARLADQLEEDGRRLGMMGAVTAIEAACLEMRKRYATIKSQFPLPVYYLVS